MLHRDHVTPIKAYFDYSVMKPVPVRHASDEAQNAASGSEAVLRGSENQVTWF